MKIKKYPDGSGYVDARDSTNEVVTFRINSYEDLWHLNQYVDAYVSSTNGMYPTILIPNLLDAQADRRFNRYHSSGLKLVLEFLNGMKAKFKIFHPHNPEVVEAVLGNKVEIIDNSEFIRRVIYPTTTSKSIVDTKRLVLMSADAGGYKPLMKLCDTIDWKGKTYSASKARSYMTTGVKIVQLIDKQDFKGRDILIVDDICVYGGTFKGLAKMLRERNCGKLYLAVSHMTVRDLGDDPVTDYFDKVFTTNSKYDSYYHKQILELPKNLEIIKLFKVN